MQIQKTLGKGSYGTVYRAKRFSDGKLYALKEADVGKMTPIERKDAVNEIRLMASIKHENIVRYNEAILDGGVLNHHPCMYSGKHFLHLYNRLPQAAAFPALRVAHTGQQGTSCALSWSLPPMATYPDSFGKGRS